MICPKCGAQVADNNSFCTSCGASVNRAAAADVNGEEATVFAGYNVPPEAVDKTVAAPGFRPDAVQQQFGQPMQQPPKKKNAAPVIGAVVAVLVVLGVVFGVVFGIVLPNKEKDDDDKGKKNKKETTTVAEPVYDGGYSDVLVSEEQFQPMSKTISVGLYSVLAVNGDGTVAATGDNRDGVLDVDGWRDIVAVSTSGHHTLGLKSDGTVVATGDNAHGACDVGGWSDIVSVSSGLGYSVGLKADGTVVTAGRNDYGKCDVDGWTDIVAVSAGSMHTVGIRADGTVVAVGDNSTGACDVGGWTDIIAVSLGYGHTIGLKADGTVVVAGNAGNGSSCDVGGWRDIVAISTNDRYTIGIRKDGTVVSTIRDTDKSDTADYTYLKNKLAQLRGVVAVSAPGIFGYDIAALKSDGTVVLISMVIYWVENNIDRIDFEYDTSGWSGIKIIIPDRFRTPDNGGNKLPEPVVEVTVPVTEPVTEPATVIVTEIVTEPSTTRPAQRPTQPTTQRPTQRPTQAPTQRPTQRPTQVPTTREPVTEVVTAPSKGLTTGNATLIADYYNKAVVATADDAPKGWQTMVLTKPIDGDGAIDTILKVLQPVVDNVLADNAKETNGIPGGKEGDLLPTDIDKATAISKNGKTTLTIMIKQQVDGPDCDKNTAGPVARGIGTFGNFDVVLDALGAELVSGRDTVKLTYKDVYIKCVIDEETGRIESGTWFYTVDIFIGDAQAKLAGVSANLKNLTAAVDYRIVID